MSIMMQHNYKSNMRLGVLEGALSATGALAPRYKKHRFSRKSELETGVQVLVEFGHWVVWAIVLHLE